MCCDGTRRNTDISQVQASNEIQQKISSICSIWFIFFRRIECFCRLQWNIINIFAVEVLIVLEAQAKKKSNASSTAEFINPASQGTKSPKQSIGDSQNGGQRSECAQKAGVWPQLVFPDRELLGFARLINGKSNC